VAIRNDLINLKLIIEYDGKNYFGWQRQSKESNKPTIQQTIEQSLQVLLKGEKIQLIGSGRTDSGVHALNQCANVKVTHESLEKFGGGSNYLSKLAYSLNSLLPDDIVIKKITRAKDDFHARYSAKERAYEYYLTTEKHALNSDKLYYIKTKFDIDLAEEFCKLLIGYRSFKSLCKNKSDEYGYKCDVTYASVKKLKGGIIKFEIKASRFLHSMIRAVVGAMINVASGKISLKEFQSKFKKGEEIKSQYVPAKALFLTKVKY
jgi:tRNA pseudouridine38-40 synthase